MGVVVRWVEAAIELTADHAGASGRGAVLGEHPVADVSHGGPGRAGNVEEAGEEDLGLGEPEVESSVDAAARGGVGELPSRSLCTNERLRLKEGRPARITPTAGAANRGSPRPADP